LLGRHAFEATEGFTLDALPQSELALGLALLRCVFARRFLERYTLRVPPVGLRLTPTPAILFG
jgi:hypothetical protein